MNKIRVIISPKPKKEKIGYFTLIDKTIVSASLQMVQLTIEKNPPDILVNISRDTCGTYDFYRAEELVEIGRQSAIISLDEFEKEVIFQVETSFQDAENTNH